MNEERSVETFTPVRPRLLSDELVARLVRQFNLESYKTPAVVIEPSPPDASRCIPVLVTRHEHGQTVRVPMFHFGRFDGIAGCDRRGNYLWHLQCNPNERWPAAVDWTAEEWAKGKGG